MVREDFFEEGTANLRTEERLVEERIRPDKPGYSHFLVWVKCFTSLPQLPYLLKKMAGNIPISELLE